MLVANPWFWAFLAALGWGLCTGLVGSRALGRRLRLGISVVLLAEVPRALLPLPFVLQPRIEAGHPVFVAAGAAVLAGSLFFATPVFRIAPFTAPARRRLSRLPGTRAASFPSPAPCPPRMTGPVQPHPGWPDITACERFPRFPGPARHDHEEFYGL